MGNLAKGKLPQEKGVWSNAEQATNGNHTKYSGNSGWASARHPANYTIDLGENYPIRQIRLLLFDGLGHSANRDARNYQFEIQLSEDGENYFLFFSNRDVGGNGWFIIDFANDISAKFVRFVGINNDANAHIHLVEIEVFDIPPKELPRSQNIHRGIAGGTMPNSKYFENLVKAALAEAGSGLGDILKEKERATAAADKLVESADLKTLVQRFAAFSDAISEGQDSVHSWARVSIGLAVFLGLILGYFIFCDDGTITILKELVETFGNKDGIQSFGGAQAFLHYRMGLYLISRVALLSILVFLLSWSLRNYRAERHNLLVNKHKAMSIATALQLNTDEKIKDTPKGEIILEAIRAVFSHQGTGYEKSDPNDNAGINVVNKISDAVK